MLTRKDAIMVPPALIRTEWPPHADLTPGGSERFDAVYNSLQAGEQMREPIKVRGDTWTVIDGCHRLQAARLLGIEWVPVVVWTGTEWLPRSSDAPEAERVQRLEKVAEAAKALRSEHRADFMDDGARQDRLYELFQLLDEHDEAAALAELDAGEGTC